ncbi:hypothetical protein [Ensifer soli]|uniref:hypothetical protein n=1 Tax=Ciceribacter sp. sgz301302 TaxID=3342379 RepID=UPI0035B9C3A1
MTLVRWLSAKRGNLNALFAILIVIVPIYTIGHGRIVMNSGRTLRVERIGLFLKPIAVLVAKVVEHPMHILSSAEWCLCMTRRIYLDIIIKTQHGIIDPTWLESSRGEVATTAPMS